MKISGYTKTSIFVKILLATVIVLYTAFSYRRAGEPTVRNQHDWLHAAYQIVGIILLGTGAMLSLIYVDTVSGILFVVFILVVLMSLRTTTSPALFHTNEFQLSDPTFKVPAPLTPHVSDAVLSLGSDHRSVSILESNEQSEYAEAEEFVRDSEHNAICFSDACQHESGKQFKVYADYMKELSPLASFTKIQDAAFDMTTDPLPEPALTCA